MYEKVGEDCPRTLQEIVVIRHAKPLANPACCEVFPLEGEVVGHEIRQNQAQPYDTVGDDYPRQPRATAEKGEYLIFKVLPKHTSAG